MKNFLIVFLSLFIHSSVYATAKGRYEFPISLIPVFESKNAWLIEDHSVPLVFVEISFEKTGSAYAPKDKEGLQALYAQLFQKARRGGDHHRFNLEIDQLKLSVSAMTNQDFFNFSLSFPKNNWTKILPLIHSLIFDAEFSIEDIIQAKLGLGGVDFAHSDPDIVATQALMAKVFQDHPYATHVSGKNETVQFLMPQDIQSFPKDFFAQENIKMSFLGDVSAEDVKAFCTTVFPNLPKEMKYKPQPLPEAKFSNFAEPLNFYQNIPQTIIHFFLPCPQYGTKEWVFAKMTNLVLGHGDQSRLWNSIRTKHGWAYSIQTDIRDLKAGSYIEGCLSTQTEQVKDVMAKIKEEIQKLNKTGFKEEDLSFAKNYISGKMMSSFHEPHAIIQAMQSAQLKNLEPNFMQNYVQSVEKVTLSELNDFIKSWLDPSKLCFAIVGKHSSCPLPQN